MLANIQLKSRVCKKDGYSVLDTGAPRLTEASTFRVVGIGASAGGIEALRHLFQNAPWGDRFCFVIVLHLAPGRTSLLAEVVGRWTAMPVLEATEGAMIAGGHVFIAPPGILLELANGRFQLAAVDVAPGGSTSIDSFFNSLATDQGANAVGIVLSGAGRDGALGLKAIKEAGGTTIVQGSNHTWPEFDSMPAAAIATGSIDMILPVDAIPRYLLDCQADNQANAPAPEADTADAIGAARLGICAILRAQVGHDFSHYKEPTFVRRVQRRMAAISLDVAGYMRRLEQDPGEAMLLLRDLLIGVTSFFRDAETFEAARALVPRLFDGRGPDDRVRAWIPGCSTGEEAYSIAMLLQEFRATLPRPPALQIFASDIDEAAIGIARAGRYPAMLMKPVSAERRQRFFVESKGQFTVTRELRDLCTFSVHSVIRDPPFSRLDLLSCRNLLIYLDTHLQSQVIPAFHAAILPGGILLLGRSEAVSRHANLFSVIDKKNRIFSRCDIPGPSLPVMARTLMGQSALPNAIGKDIMKLNPNHALQAAHARVQAHFAPAFVLVNAEGDAVHFAPGAGRYLQLAPGTPTRNLGALARDGLRSELRALLRRVLQTGAGGSQENVQVKLDGGTQIITLTVEPLPLEDDSALFLVVFVDQGPMQPDDAPGPGEAGADTLHIGLIEQHERELHDTREQLQSTTEEYETAVEELKSANEELHSINEELQSTNEEMETSKEEVQSMNEELQTVNGQLVVKIDDLDRANSDLANLFESTKVGTVFLDEHVIIRSFTPAITSIYNLIASDIGRPVTDITSQLDYTTLREDLALVLRTLEPLERRVTSLDRASFYLMRMLPYRGLENAVDGALVSFLDVTGIVEAEQQQRLLVDELNHRVKNMLTVVISMVRQTLRGSETLDDFSTTFLGRLQALATAYTLLSHENWTEVELKYILQEELAPYQSDADPSNVVLQGPGVALRPGAALAFGMIVHELATNAVKYGALSVSEGRVMVAWRFEKTAAGERLVWHWRESHGPVVTPPSHRGFGVQLIERSIGHELNGEASVQFLETGLEAVLTIPLNAIRVVKVTELRGTEE